MRVPVFFINGFLDSGKTTFLNQTIIQDYFYIEGKTLLLLCEEGEVEYDPQTLEELNISVETIDSFEDLNLDNLNGLEKKYKPERVIIEFNGMWPVRQFEELDFPKGWGIIQQITTVDAQTFLIYMNNMKQLFNDMVKNSDMVLFNRCDPDNMPLATFRRGVKVVNQGAEIIFEDTEGELCDIFKDELPFDDKAKFIDLPPEDYGIWYVDALDHPEKYKGKMVRFQARAIKSKKADAPYFVPGRMAMTCCANDMTLIGFVCNTSEAYKYKEGQWLDITAKVDFGYSKVYGKKGIILIPKKIEPCEELAEPLVYFN